MTTWNHLFAYSKWDRYFSNQQRADKSWVGILMDEAIRALPPRVPDVPFLGYEKKVFYEYEANYKSYPAG